MIDAALAGRREELQALCQPLGPEGARKVFMGLAEQLSRPGLWAGALTAFDLLGELTPQQKLYRQLAANLACLQEHRPQVHALLFATPGSPHYLVIPSTEGNLTIGHRNPQGTVTSMSPGNAPLKALDCLRSGAEASYRRGDPITLSGIGDGYLVRWMANNPPKLFQNRQQAVYLVESDPRAAIVCMMIHDFTDEAGPIRCPRFHWAIGPDWQQQLVDLLNRRPGLPMPGTSVCQGITGGAIDQAILKLGEQIDEQLLARLRSLEGEYATHTASHLAALLSPTPPRPPRALLVTTRFTNTLKYSNADLAQALAGYGWEVQVLDEPLDHEIVSERLVQSEIARFRPDVVFQINHLRHEYHQAVPAQLPWICWIQDHQVQLTSAYAGERVGPRDFILTGARFRYVEKYGYPADRCIDMAKLTRGDSYGSAADRHADMAYVSHWSPEPRQVLDNLLQGFRHLTEKTNVIAAFECCGQRMLRWYEAGKSLKTHYGVRELVRQALAEAGLSAQGDASEDYLTFVLFERLNNPLYRQQALIWAAELSEELGLSFNLYGDGWENHPRFGKYARGRVQYGQALAEMHRGTRLNLQLEPYACISHQRMLDGLAAGGFFLVREHPFNKRPQELASFLDARLPRSIESLPALRKALPPQDRPEFERLLHNARALGELGDPIWVLRCWQNGQLLSNQGQFLPDLEAVSFDSKDQLREKILHFLPDEPARHEIARRQYAFIENRLTYRAAFRRALDEIRQRIERIGDEPVHTGQQRDIPWRDAAAELGRAERWEELETLLLQQRYRDQETQRRMILAANLAALQKHRPEVYREVLAAAADGAYQITKSPSFTSTISHASADGKLACLSPGGDPKSFVPATLKTLTDTIRQGHFICLCGIGDGYLLQQLAVEGESCQDGRQMPVLVVEPDARLVRTCMELHIYSEDAGAIPNRRIRWVVGKDWREQLHALLTENPYTGTPRASIPQGPCGEAVEAQLKQILDLYAQQDQALAQEVEAIYASRPAGESIDALSAAPARKPRVLLLTTRFSTVLQYSTRDAAEAFRQLGWETHTIIEPERYAQITHRAVNLALRDFRPDLVFQIDHLRYEHGNLFPRSLPFVGWIQDHLPNLTCAEAGRSLGPTDFVMTGATYRYVQKHSYPRSCCIDTGKPAPSFQIPESWESDGEDLIYISNRSQTPEQTTLEILQTCSGDPRGRNLLEACCNEMIALYAQEIALPTLHDIRQLVLRMERKTGIVCLSLEVRDQVVWLLFDQLNNVLYRQQTLFWAARLAREKGLRLGLYGRGWDRHPHLSPYARGMIQHGERLAQLTRNAKINLQLEPYACYSHQRMLDGLMAGGFFLVREHPFNTKPTPLAAFLDEHAPGAMSIQAADAMMPKPARKQFHALLAQCPEIAEMGDVVEVIRCWQKAQILPPEPQPLPRLNQITFSSYETFVAAVERFLANPEARRSILLQQREAIRERLTYVPLMRRVITEIHQRLASTLNSSGPGSLTLQLSRRDLSLEQVHETSVS